MGRTDDAGDPLVRARRDWVRHDLPGADMVIAMTSLVRAHQIAEGRVDRALRPFGLNAMTYNALRILSFASSGRPMGRVAWGLMIHPATVTAVIDKLERQGLVERRTHPTDRRAVLAGITDQGRALVEEATHALVAIKFGLEGLTVAQMRDLRHLLTPLRESAGDIVAAPAADER
jgi:DNA-binding MarR family transcriptional regulator